jgi:nucleoside-diphosphate-sugar epimerase
MVKKVVITGSGGVIGNILMKGLDKERYVITPADLPDIDVRDYGKVCETLRSKDAAIHLAWNTDENYLSLKTSPENSVMFENVYRAAKEMNVKRVIMASSIHADSFSDWKGPGFMSVERNSVPKNPYGSHKIFMEKMGSVYAHEGLEVICIRFGGVVPLTEKYGKDIKEIGLTHGDCIGIVEACLDAKEVPNNFAVIYGISENESLRIHDYSNPFGWKPKDNAAVFYSFV